MIKGGEQIAFKRRDLGGAGFTLIELLVAMAILLVIVMIVAQLFQQARQVVDTGTRRAEMNMKGRAVADFMAQELSMAVLRPKQPNFDASGSSAHFDMLVDATGEHGSAIDTVNYGFNGDKAIRGAEPLCGGLKSIEFVSEYGASTNANELPLFVDVIVTVTDTNTLETKIFESRAFMVHRRRYSMD